MVRWSGKNQGVLRVKCHPSDIDESIRVRGSVIEGCSFGDGGEEEGHAIMIEGGAPLAH